MAVDYGAATGDDSRGTTKVGGSYAIAIGLFNDAADAIINGNAVVDAQGDITVNAETINEIDPYSLWGVNLITPFLEAENLDDEADFTDADTAVTLQKEAYVDVYNSSYFGIADETARTDGNQYLRYQYIAEAPRYNVDLTTEDFSDPLYWIEIQPVQNALKEMTQTIATYLDSNLGLNDNLVDSWTVSRANGQEQAYAGAISMVILKHDADAVIKSGAQINQDVDFQALSDAQNVNIAATSISHMVNIGGNFQPFGVQGDVNKPKPKGGDDDAAESKGLIKPTAVGPGAGSRAADGGTAVGITMMAYVWENNVSAQIEDGVVLYADSLDVAAKNQVVSVTLGASGGQADSLAVNGTMLGNVVLNTTLAQIGDGATIVVGDGTIADSNNSVKITADDKAYIFSVAGSFASSETTGVGASVAINVIERDTEALIGNRYGDSTANSWGGSFTSAGNVLIEADNGGVVAAMALAGSKVSQSTAADDDDAPTDSASDSKDASNFSGIESADGSTTVSPELMKTNQSQSYQEYISTWAPEEESSPGQAGMGVSGSVTINYGDDDARAYVYNAGTINVADLTIAADDSTIYASLSGAMAYVKDDNAGTAKGIAGALSVNYVTGTAEATVDGAISLVADSLDFDATRTGWVVSLTAGIAGATGRQGTALAGSVAIVRTTYTTSASLKNTTATITNGININAVDSTNVILVAGSAAFGGKVGVGAAVAFTEIENTTKATMENVVDLEHGSDVSLAADATGLIVAVTGAVGVATGGGGESGFGAAGTLSINFIDNTVAAEIINTNSLANSTGDLILLAQDSSNIWSFAGGFGYGKTTGLGFAIGLNFITNTIDAGISGSTLTSNGTLDISATEASVLGVLVVGGAGAEKLAIAGGVAASQTKFNQCVH
jgi:hypothetical protein